MKKIFTTLTAIAILFTSYVSTYAATTGDATLTLKPSVTSTKKGDKFKVDIILKNPSAKKVISVRSWLSYDSKSLKAVSIDTKTSKFTLGAPGEDTISSSENKIKIGRSNISGGVTATETTVATINFEVIASTAVSSKISFYDYQVSELGHTSVNIIESGFPLNILSKSPDGIAIPLNSGSTAVKTTTVIPTKTTTTTTGSWTTSKPAPITPKVTITTTPTPTTAVGGSTIVLAGLVRPTNLKVNTGSGYVDLKWDAATDSSRIGFNIYYGKTSGQYTRRRNINNTNTYRLSGLNNKETYYFAVTAYDKSNNESNYSNEVGVIINQPLSSTNPFTTLFQKTVSKIPNQPQNGPLVGWLLFSAAGLSGVTVFGRKKYKK